MKFKFMNNKHINTTKRPKNKVFLFFKKRNVFGVISLLVIVCVFGIIVFKKTNNDFIRLIKPIRTPKIPEEISSYMNTQTPPLGYGCGENSFKWFSFYDTESKQKVKTKFSGLCSPHFHSLGNQSVNFDLGKETLRLKSLSSETHPGDISEQPFALIFSEYATYEMAKEFTKYTPSSGLVYLNSDTDDIRIRLNDDFNNVVRENNFISWDYLLKIRNYAQGKEVRFFDEAWKTKNNSQENLEEKFTQFLNPFLDAVSQKQNLNTKTDMDTADYARYLALNSAFASTHMDSHNLTFTFEPDNGQWHPILYDLSGFSYPTLSIMPNLNYISEFFLRNPNFILPYLADLNKINNEFLGKNKISKFYSQFDCENIADYPNFSEILLKTTNTWVQPADINGFCASVKKIQNFESARHDYISGQLDSADFRWSYTKNNGETFLVVWNPTIIPVKIDKIKCGLYSCDKKWQRVNQMWWEADQESEIISSDIIRIKADTNANPQYRYTKNQFRLIPQPAFYVYKWIGKDQAPQENKISFSVSNAATEKKSTQLKTSIR